MKVVEPRWASWSFLLYAGGLTIGGAALFLLARLSRDHGEAAYSGWAFVFFAAAAAVALGLRRGGRHPVAAGLLAVVAVALFAGFVASLYSWAGWLEARDSPFHGFDLARLTLFASVIAAGAAALRLFRFPLLVWGIASAAWLFTTDLLSGGGNGSAAVSFLVGLAFLALAAFLDTGGHHPYAFWLHVAAGLSIGGSLVWFLHDGDLEWALVAVGGLLYIALADRLGRSSWAVLGALGILMSASHFARAGLAPLPLLNGVGDSSSEFRAATVFGLVGVALMLLGGLLARRAAQRATA